MSGPSSGRPGDPPGDPATAGASSGDPGSEAGWARVCPAGALAERGDGVRFDLVHRGGSLPAFVLRIDGAPVAYLNQCAHVPVELDWNPGRFLDDTGTGIVCATHGAVYDAADGACIGGPCRGRGLQPVPCREVQGWVEVQAAVAVPRRPAP
ncbi:MAG TPA: Rieske 2Fe-2S domain-containing protein [Burkholderiaceae bacterium]|nr:Rieske 2Fe-2S domain-containing protein [Burkholderiaceae bacterium]